MTYVKPGMLTLDKIEHMILNGVFVPPDTFDNLSLGIDHIRRMATERRDWRDLPDVTRALLLRFVKESLDLLNHGVTLARQ